MQTEPSTRSTGSWNGIPHPAWREYPKPQDVVCLIVYGRISEALQNPRDPGVSKNVYPGLIYYHWSAVQTNLHSAFDYGGRIDFGNRALAALRHNEVEFT